MILMIFVLFLISEHGILSFSFRFNIFLSIAHNYNDDTIITLQNILTVHTHTHTHTQSVCVCVCVCVCALARERERVRVSECLRAFVRVCVCVCMWALVFQLQTDGDLAERLLDGTAT